jgi:hypothetical protein
MLNKVVWQVEVNYLRSIKRVKIAAAPADNSPT